MKMNRQCKQLFIIFGLLTVTVFAANAQQKKPFDHDVYDLWNHINESAISNNGDWVLFSLGPREKDAELRVKGTASDRFYRVARGEKAEFSADSKFAVFQIKAFADSVKQAKRDKKKDEQMPKDSLGILNLDTGDIIRVARVKSFQMPEKAGGWVAYLLEKAIAKKDTSEKKAEATEKGKELGEKKPDKKDDEKKKKKAEGTELVLRNLNSGEESVFADAVSYHFSDNGKWLVYTAANKDSSADGIFAVETTSGKATPILTGAGDYKQVALDEAGTQVAFLANRDDFQSDQPSYTFYYWKIGSATPKALAKMGTSGIPEGWWVSEHGEVSFSKNGKRVFFGTAPKPAPEPDEEEPEDEKVKLDIWNWKDPLLQPMQLKNVKRENERSYRAVVQLDKGQVVQLANENIPEIFLAEKGDLDLALGSSNLPYRQLISWDSPRYYDFYIVDVKAGNSRLVQKKLQDNARLSPAAKYIFWWDRDKLTWYALSTKGGDPVNVSAKIPYPLEYELHDWPYKPDSYGNAGWTKNDEMLLLYDKHDIWAVDPNGRNAPRCITEEFGRKNNLRFRYVQLDREETAIDPQKPMLLSVFDLKTKADGYYRDQVNTSNEPGKLIMVDAALGRLRKAKDSDRLLFTRESFQEFPDLWVADLDFNDMHKMSDANPQQSDYLWGTAELVEWNSADGVPLQGILYKPENFDPNKKYPMMVYFYEKMSDGLHRHQTPAPSRSSINFTFYASRGYVVFVPDIPYKVGFPGESCVNAVVPGILHLVNLGFVDRERIGVQGHSWGGYQIAYMVTRTNIFRAAEAGAPVANMTSAYGGIRWGSGMSRMFQYEKSQSRIGGTLWESTQRYIENSPLFWADKIETPVLMMHNDGDTAVPWYQGIEFFVALRRLGKPVWMLNYNGEAHGLGKYINQKDFAVRMQQYFDYYLKDAPVPVWMQEGVPAVEKGKTLGLEPVSTNGSH